MIFVTFVIAGLRLKLDWLSLFQARQHIGSHTGRGVRKTTARTTPPPPHCKGCVTKIIENIARQRKLYVRMRHHVVCRVRGGGEGVLLSFWWTEAIM
jgi:hypothetical protein